MKLLSLRMRNFRQFLGEHNIEFSTDKLQNTTVILGLNGYGKSTILNAIHWALYGSLQQDFKDPKRLLSSEAQPTSSVEVELIMSADKCTYNLLRKLENGKPSVQLIQKDGTNRQRIIENHASLIQKLIPKEMASHFIFHGEKKIDHKDTGKVQKSIRDIIGITILTQLENILKTSEKRLLSNLGKGKKNQDEISEIANNITQLSYAIEQLNSVIKSNEALIKQNKEWIESIDSFLLQHEFARGHKTQQEQLEKEHSNATEELKSIEKLKIEWLRTQATSMLTTSIEKVCAPILSDEVMNDRIPGEYRKNFIQGLIDSNECICGRPFAKDSLEYKTLAKVMTNAYGREMTDSLIEVKQWLEWAEKNRTAARERIYEILEQQKRIIRKIEQTEAQIKELKNKLIGCNVDEVQQKAKDREMRRQDVERRTKDLGKHSLELTNKQAELNLAKEALVRKQKEGGTNNQFDKAINLVGQLQRFLNEQTKKYESDAKQAILDTINNSVCNVMNKPYEVFFTPDGDIKLRDKITLTTVNGSSGEDQIVMLTFTGALIAYSRARSEKTTESDLLLDGTIAPLVLDSPYGQLDKGFQTTASDLLPKLAEQVILLLSDTQAKLLFESKATERIGRIYVIQTGPKPESDSISNSVYQICGDKTLSTVNENVQPACAHIIEVS
jgi:DNA sulfur modification protein DndD